MLNEATSLENTPQTQKKCYLCVHLRSLLALTKYTNSSETLLIRAEITREVTLGLSAGGPLSRTEAASSGLKSKPKERGGWDLCFGASLSTAHCDETEG